MRSHLASPSSKAFRTSPVACSGRIGTIRGMLLLSCIEVRLSYGGMPFKPSCVERFRRSADILELIWQSERGCRARMGGGARAPPPETLFTDGEFGYYHRATDSARSSRSLSGYRTYLRSPVRHNHRP